MKRIGFIPSSVGYHWEEVYDPFVEFRKHGYTIDFFTVNGKPALADPRSLEVRPILSYLGLGLRNSYSPSTEAGKELLRILQQEVKPVTDLWVENYDALYIPGGHGCLFDVNTNKEVHDKIQQAFDQDKIIAAVCHGSSALSYVHENGISIIQGKRIIGFPDIMDKFLLMTQWIHPKFLPLPYWNEEKIREAGAAITLPDIIWGILNPTYHLIDLPFITGVGPKSAKSVAKAVIHSLQQEITEKKQHELV